MKKILILAFVSVALFSSCSEENGGGDKTPDKARDNISLSRAETDVLDKTNQFAIGLMERYAEENPNTNFVISPLSLSMALSMTANGADGLTQEEILTTLGFGKAAIFDANSLNKKLLNALPSTDNSTKVAFANAMWFDSNAEDFISPEFTATLSKYYDSPLNIIDDLGSEKGMNAINSWSKEHTSNLIPQLLSKPLDSRTLMALTNALYFKGSWASKFDKKNTTPSRFINLDLSTSQVEMMNRRQLAAQAFQDDSYKAIALPYGNNAYCMVILVPEFGTHPANLFTAENLESILQLVKEESFETHVNLSLPRFSVENTIDFVPILKDLGINEAFTEKADFSGLWTEPVEEFCISIVLQASKIIVDEEGTEAASSSLSSGMATSPGPIKSEDFIVDRPFAFAIAERTSGTILFTGAITNL